MNRGGGGIWGEAGETSSRGRQGKKRQVLANPALDRRKDTNPGLAPEVMAARLVRVFSASECARPTLSA
jgi:hypothetical protein